MSIGLSVAEKSVMEKSVAEKSTTINLHPLLILLWLYNYSFQSIVIINRYINV